MSSGHSSTWLKFKAGFICAGSKPLNGGEDVGDRPFFRHYDALAVGFSANFLSQWEQLNSSQKTVSLMCSLVTNQLITDRKGATQILNNNLSMG